ncbi:hypothetical protein [Mycobacterium uberis]|uniref:hypothetical protein n=1 Tax=Mycobacterium uberis TaxID=2162698 RepID=UPI001401ED09|nr:hypothetical protein [Mycobacterium uberis]
MEPKAAQSRHLKPATAQPLIGKGRVQSVASMMIFGFLVMGILFHFYQARHVHGLL